ncbi:hypothetical protein L7F22_035734 [Adiantum nelumboides]|nr:hypothetical protein [Adiantum nelumboides]
MTTSSSPPPTDETAVAVIGWPCGCRGLATWRSTGATSAVASSRSAGSPRTSSSPRGCRRSCSTIRTTCRPRGSSTGLTASTPGSSATRRSRPARSIRSSASSWRPAGPHSRTPVLPGRRRGPGRGLRRLADQPVRLQPRLPHQPAHRDGRSHAAAGQRQGLPEQPGLLAAGPDRAERVRRERLLDVAGGGGDGGAEPADVPVRHGTGRWCAGRTAAARRLPLHPRQHLLARRALPHLRRGRRGNRLRGRGRRGAAQAAGGRTGRR